MASLLFRRKWILAALESTYGTPPAIAAADGVLTKNLSITQYGGNTISRDIDRSTLGNDTVINTGPNVQVSFDVEMAGSAAAGTVPPWDALLRACGLGATNTPVTDSVYAPVDTGFESVAMNFFHGGNMQVIAGMRGNVQFVMERNQIPVMRFTFIGLYARPTTTAEVAPDVSDYRTPVPITNSNTPTFTSLGFAANLEGLTIDMGNNVVYRNLVGNEEVLITDRRMTFSMTVEAVDIADNDFFADIEAHNGITTGAIQLIHGPSPDRFTLDADSAQYNAMSLGESDALGIYELGGVLTPDGSNEFSLTLD